MIKGTYKILETVEISRGRFNHKGDSEYQSEFCPIDMSNGFIKTRRRQVKMCETPRISETLKKITRFKTNIRIYMPCRTAEKTENSILLSSSEMNLKKKILS